MFDNFRLIRLTPDHIIKPFDCGDSDLNEFLLLYSQIFSKELFAVTYIIENDLKTVAFFSVLNSLSLFKNGTILSTLSKRTKTMIPD